MIRIALLALAVMLAGCNSVPNPVYVALPLDRPVPPTECTGLDPRFPVLPDGDLDAETIVKDRMAIKTRDIEIQRRRAVCRAWLKEQAGSPKAAPAKAKEKTNAETS